MIPRVFCSLIANQKRCSAATLHGYKRTRIQGADYPAIKPSEGGLVSGMVWHDINADEFDVLDQFESIAYSRQSVEVELDQDQTVECKTYVYRPEFYHCLIDEPWSLEEFERFHLASFLNRHQL